MSILKEFSGKGIESQLLSEIINYAKSINLKILELEVRLDNMIAVYLYKKIVFIEYGLYEYFMSIDYKYHNGTVMSLDLNKQY